MPELAVVISLPPDSAEAAAGSRFVRFVASLLLFGPIGAAGSLIRVPLLGAVGPLQFEVLKYRLEDEYGEPCRIESSPWKNVIRWVGRKSAPANTSSSCPTSGSSTCCRNAIGISCFWTSPIRHFSP